GCEEAGGEVAAVVLKRERWHRESHVVAEERDERVDVGGDEGLCERLDELALGVRVWRWRRVAVGLAVEPPVERRAGALQRAGHRLLRGIEHRGDLRGVEAEDVAEDQDRALAR